MIFLSEIATYLPNNKINNLSRLVEHNTNENFIKEKIGVETLSVKDPDTETSDLCVESFRKLKKNKQLIDTKIDCLIVCTQNPDKNGIPHTSSIIHSKLGLNENCACFDISLGCSGYVYSLSIIKSFMQSNGLSNGLLFTCDPYSKILDMSDKNTSLLFSDAATVTYLRSGTGQRKLESELSFGKFLFSTKGKDGQALNNNDGKLLMDGRKIFNFSAKEIPIQVSKILKNSNKSINDIDLFIFHQGSKAIIKFLEKKLQIPEKKIFSNLINTGNTVSSSIPMILEKILEDNSKKSFLLSGFGVGLSWATCILEREIKDEEF